MDYRSKFVVEPGAKVRLSKIDAAYTGKQETHEAALPKIQKHVERLDKLQYLLYADGSQSLLVVLQALVQESNRVADACARTIDAATD